MPTVQIGLELKAAANISGGTIQSRRSTNPLNIAGVRGLVKLLHSVVEAASFAPVQSNGQERYFVLDPRLAIGLCWCHLTPPPGSALNTHLAELSPPSLG